MSSYSPNGNPLDPTEPYGGTTPPIPGPKFLEMVMPSGSGSLKVAIVSDVWTHNQSCTVIPINEGSGPGVPCLWGESTRGRFGGVADISPPHPGSAVFVFIPPTSGYGYVLCSIPSLRGSDPDPESRLSVDALPLVKSEDDDSGGNPDASGSTSMSMAAATNKTPSDVFPGDRGFFNELGMAIALLGFRSIFKASELAKIEAFAQDDLVRLTSHFFDHWTSRSERCLRESPGGESLDYELSGEIGPNTRSGKWSGVKLEGAAGDARREFRIESGDEKPEETLAKKGLSEKFDDSAGVLLERSLVMAGIIKSPVIQVPFPISESLPGDTTFEAGEPDTDGLADFNWGEKGDLQMQIRDYLAWVLNRQANAALKPMGNSVSIPDSASDAAIGTPDSAPGSDGYLRGDLIGAEIKSATGKSRRVKLGDAWALVMPDGSVSIRDAWGSAISMSHGNITISPSNDLILRPGRNLVVKPGKDAVIAPKGHVDISAADGQVRVWGLNGAMVHGERGGVMISTHAEDSGTSPVGTSGEGFIPAGLVLKAPGTITNSCAKFVSHSNDFLLTGLKADEPPIVTVNSSQTLINYEASLVLGNQKSEKFFQFSDFGLEMDGDLLTNEGNILAGKGQVLADSVLSSDGEMGKIDRSQEKSDPDKKSLGDRLKSISKAAKDAFGFYHFFHLHFLEFSFRSEKNYGDPVKLFEQPWEREWKEAEEWGEDAISVGPKTGRRSWSWPGRKGWTGNSGYKKYEEVNVDGIGFPVSQMDMRSQPGTTSEVGLKKMKKHPSG